MSDTRLLTRLCFWVHIYSVLCCRRCECECMCLCGYCGEIPQCILARGTRSSLIRTLATTKHATRCRRLQLASQSQLTSVMLSSLTRAPERRRHRRGRRGYVYVSFSSPSSLPHPPASLLPAPPPKQSSLHSTFPSLWPSPSPLSELL